MSADDPTANPDEPVGPEPTEGPDGTDGPGHPDDETLRRELAGRTDRDESARLVAHLDGCARCRDRLDDLGESPVELPAGDPVLHDGRHLRRAVRRTLLSVALQTAGLLVLGVILLNLVGQLVIHPLAVDRGDRLDGHVAAAVDLPVLLRPGAEVREYLSNPGIVRRTTEVRLERHVGGTARDLGEYALRLSPFSTNLANLGESTSLTPGFGPRLSEDPSSLSTPAFEPERFGEGVAATVELAWHDGLTRGQAATLADDDDVALTWVGFAVADLPAEDPLSRLGYSACARLPDRDLSGRGASFGSSGSRSFLPPGDGVDEAYRQVQRAVDNLASHGPDVTRLGGALADPAATATWLADNEPDVTSVVLTGSVAAIAETIEATGPDTAGLLDADLDRAPPQPCG